MTDSQSLTAEPVARQRVLHIITALGTGGAERQLESLVRHSHTDSSTITLYGDGVVADAMRESGHEVTDLGLQDRGIFGKLTAALRLSHMIRQRTPDVVHVHLLAAQLWGIPAARLAGVKRIISSEHSLMDNSIESRPLTPMLRRVYRMLERMTAHTVAVSDTTKLRLQRWGIRPDRISVVDNGIDFDALTFSGTARTRARAAWGAADSTTVVGAVGRLDPIKRFPELVTALAPWLLAGDRKLVVVGAGPLLDALQQQAADLGVQDRVLLLGAQADIASLLSGFDLLVSPCRDETFGMAIVEAVGAGLPVVYAQCPALEELDPIPGAFPLNPTEAATEAAAIITAVDSAIGMNSDVLDADGRLPVPPTVLHAYGIARTAAVLDRIYQGESV